MGVPPPPTIEGSLKNTLNAIGFGLITAVLVVNFGKMFVSNFFVWLMVAVVVIEIFLLAVTKKRHDYEVYQAPGRKGKHTIEGAGAPQITVEPPSDGNYDSPKKKHGIRDRLRGKRESKAGLEPAGDGGYYDEDGAALTPTKLSPKLERKASKAADAEAKAEKKLEKAEEKAKEKTKGKEEAEGKGKETDAEDGEKEKSKSKGWRKRLNRKSQGESD